MRFGPGSALAGDSHNQLLVVNDLLLGLRSGGPQDQDPFDGPEPPTDCFILQNTTAVFADRDQGASGLVSALRHRFVEPREQQPTQEFRSSGFKQPFRDPSGQSPNQVRHYAGILNSAYSAASAARLAGFSFATAYAATLLAANQRERGNAVGNVADRNLNTVVVGHATRLAYGVLSPTELAKAIKDDVCDP